MENLKNTLKKTKTIAIIVAGGKSERMLGGLPKPYLHLGNTSVLRRTVKTFLEHPYIDAVRVVIRREHHAYYKKAVEDLAVIPCVIGGNSRQESVRLGLESIAYLNPDFVLVHDVARPLVNRKIITRVIDNLKENQAVIPVVKITDTVKRVENNSVTDTIPRDGLVAVQTPQGFHYQTIMNAHNNAIGQELTDDSAICELAKIPVFTVEGDASNFKITTKEDIKSMETILTLQMDTRTGTGFDVHALAEHDDDTPQNQKVIKICGVKIPFTHYLVGVSDADVAIHALVDAIIGAMGAGDIGMYFSPEDPKWQGADSQRFLLFAYELLKNRGGELVNMDVTIICERPKISEHREMMVEYLANSLKIEPHRISVKATTTERLGFTGRREGISAQAVATVRLPREVS